jgi:hypothetical protein
LTNFDSTDVSSKIIGLPPERRDSQFIREEKHEAAPHACGAGRCCVGLDRQYHRMDLPD